MKGYQFKSAWAFKRGCRNSPLEILCTKETISPRSDNTVWIDWWFESAGEGQQYSQTLTENMLLSDYQFKGIGITKVDSLATSDSFRKTIGLLKSESIDINDYVLAQLSGGQYYGILKRWSGASWANEPLKTYLSGWQTKHLKRWNGNSWVEINIGG